MKACPYCERPFNDDRTHCAFCVLPVLLKDYDQVLKRKKELFDSGKHKGRGHSDSDIKAINGNL